MTKNRYSVLGYLKIIYSLIRTKLFYSRVRLIRFPIDIRGKNLIDFGTQLTTGVGCRIEAFSPKDKKVLRFGNNVQINDYVHITAMNDISIGDNVLMASKIYISDSLHGFYKGDLNDSSPMIAPIKRDYYTSSVVIKENVWIGESVSILPGAIIGEGSIIGANSVVTSEIPSYCIAVGSPARVIKKYDFEKKIWRRI